MCTFLKGRVNQMTKFKYLFLYHYKLKCRYTKRILFSIVGTLKGCNCVNIRYMEG